MCGRFSRTSSVKEFQERVGVKSSLGGLVPRYNITPSDAILIAFNRPETNERDIITSEWGYRPSWACDKPGRRPINARQETVHNNGYFRAAFAHGRCLIAFDGWYEWKKVPGGKQPYFIKPVGEGPFCFGGIWSLCKDRQNHSCAILTTESTGSIRSIHDRMPVIIPVQDVDRWLDPDIQGRESLDDLLRGNESALEYWPVSTRVNNPRNDDPDCVQKIRLAS